jgi:hypothetical protein
MSVCNYILDKERCPVTVVKSFHAAAGHENLQQYQIDTVIYSGTAPVKPPISEHRFDTAKMSVITHPIMITVVATAHHDQRHRTLFN